MVLKYICITYETMLSRRTEKAVLLCGAIIIIFLSSHLTVSHDIIIQRSTTGTRTDVDLLMGFLLLWLDLCVVCGWWSALPYSQSHCIAQPASQHQNQQSKVTIVLALHFRLSCRSFGSALKNPNDDSGFNCNNPEQLCWCLWGCFILQSNQR